MDKEYILDTAETIRQQLVATTPFNIICSWGALHGFNATVHNGMAALKFKVNGRLFKGDVVIAYNEGGDFYEVYLVNEQETQRVGGEVYFDEMGDLIDEAVERGENPEEYQEFIKGFIRDLDKNSI